MTSMRRMNSERRFCLAYSMVARMVAARRYPVLLQGPTSAGKTSMVERLARATGHRLVRINNHEHTDVQEYIGSFQPGASGRLEFEHESHGLASCDSLPAPTEISRNSCEHIL